MQGTDAVAQILKLEGVEYLFSYPNHPLIDAAAKINLRMYPPAYLLRGAHQRGPEPCRHGLL